MLFRSAQMLPANGARSKRGNTHKIVPRAALVTQPYRTAVKCTVRRRPKVCQASVTSQSGACSLIDETRPAAEPTSNHMQAKAMNMNTGNALDWSAATRSAISSVSRSGVAVADPNAAACSDFCAASLSAGSSTVPTSPRAKMTDAARGSSTSKPCRIDQMKTNKPMIDSTKAPSKLSAALSTIAPARHSRPY